MRIYRKLKVEQIDTLIHKNYLHFPLKYKHTHIK